MHCSCTGEEGTGGSLGLLTSQAGLTDELQANENLSGKRWTPTAGPVFLLGSLEQEDAERPGIGSQLG